MKRLKAGILVFPGSNCDRDLGQSLENFFSCEVEYLWHSRSFEIQHDIYFVPGGFSYGDYLRSGALAARARSMDSLKAAIKQGRMAVGICNGFQILTESHLLEGALIRNKSLKYICRNIGLKGEGVFKDAPAGYHLPISHGEGNFIAGSDTLKRIEGEGRVIFRYSDNPNGSMNDIAGICDASRRVYGLMPHPERALLPSLDDALTAKRYGTFFFEKLFALL